MHSLLVETFTFAKPEFIGVAMLKRHKGEGVARIAFFDGTGYMDSNPDTPEETVRRNSEDAADWLSRCDPDWECFRIELDGHLRPDSKATTEYFNLAMSAWTMAKVADLGCDSESLTTLVLVSAQKVSPPGTIGAVLAHKKK